MAQKQTILTRDGLQKLESELENLKTVKRRDIADKIKVALSFGDLSENSEYDEAKNEQGMVEARIAELEATLNHVEILDSETLTTERIQIGNKIKLLNTKTSKELVFTIVGSKEVDVTSGKISDESPLGKALMGHVKGDIVETDTPSGLLSVEILDISK